MKAAGVKTALQRSPMKSTQTSYAAGNVTCISIENSMQIKPAVHELKPFDFEKRLHFCTWFHSFLHTHGICELDNIFFTDEAWFHLLEYMNSQNSWHWFTTNPHIMLVWSILPYMVKNLVCCVVPSNCGTSFLCYGIITKWLSLLNCDK